MHRTTQRIDGGNINSAGSNVNFGTQKAELVWYRLNYITIEYVLSALS